LSATIQSTHRRAPVEGGIRVVDTSIALFSEDGLKDSITAEWETALICASWVCLTCGITLLIRVSDPITTKMSGTIESASVWDGIAVSCAIIAVFTGLSNTVSTVPSAARATILVDLVAIVTLFSVIYNSVTASWECAVGSAGVWNAVVVRNSVITLLTAQRINNTVSAVESSAVQTARVGTGVAVAIKGSFGRVTVVAFFVKSSVSIVEVANSVTAAEGTVGKTVACFDTIVAFFVGVDNSIATSGDAAIWATVRIGCIGVQKCSVIAFFSSVTVNKTISAVQSARG